MRSSLANDLYEEVALFDWKHYNRFSHCRAILPWFSYARRTDPTSRFRRLVAQVESPVENLRFGFMLFAAVLFVLSSVRQVAIAMRTYAALTRREHGVNFFTQVIDLSYWVMRLNHHPHAYYSHRIALRRNRQSWRHYISHREHSLFLNTYSNRWDAGICLDKSKLFTHFRTKGIPVIDILLAAENGKLNPDIGGMALSQSLAHDLIIKPVDGMWNDGVEFWRYLPESGHYQFHRDKPNASDKEGIYGRKIPRKQLIEHLVENSRLRPFILQRWLKTHPSLQPICPHDIANFRLITSMLDGEITIGSTILRMGYDLFAGWPRNVYLSNIDPKTGILGPATSCSLELGYSDYHVETGNRVTGHQLEGWSEVKRLALLAHACAPTVPNIGWDIIHTESGVMVMEANLYFGVDMVQIGGLLLGETNYAKANLAGIR